MRQRGGGIGLAKNAQQIQRHDVTGAFPNRIHRHLAVDAGHDAFTALLHVAVTAQAFHGFLCKMAAAFADPELGHRCQQARHRLLVRVGVVVKGAGQANCQRGGRFRFQRQVGQHIAHQGLINQRFAKSPALGAMVQCKAQGLAHQAAGAQRAIKTRHRAHFEDLRNAPAFIAHQPGRGVFKLDLAAGVGLVAQLVLEALDANTVEAAVGQYTWQEKAAQSAWRLRQHQEGVTHRCREKPFVAGQPKALAPAIAAVSCGLCRVGPHVRAALLFGHAHAHGYAGFFGKQLERRVVGAVSEFGRPVGMDGGIAAQRRCDGVSH